MLGVVGEISLPKNSYTVILTSSAEKISFFQIMNLADGG
jgi:hypothetical protein